HSDALNIAPGNQITIAMWAKFTGWQRLPLGVPIDKRSEHWANYNWEFNSAVMMMRVHAGGRIYVVSVPHSLGTWNFYAMVLNGSWLGGYLNGELKASRSDVPASSGNTVNLFIGQTIAYAFRAAGIIASVLIYNRALSDAEIKAIYERGEPIRDGLVLYLDFSEGEGNVAYDKSGYGNHGTVYGARWVVKKASRVLPKAR
ncbi:MAG: LamG domain-containing protein, partial [Thermofilaceae archaeon]